ncbi:MAG: hypothetical protein ABW167_19585 [Baekduia sp.]
MADDDEELREAWQRVTAALIGSWPGQVASWGEVAIEAFIGEVAQRGLQPQEAVAAIRAIKSDYAPSAGTLVAVAERQRQGPVPDFMTAHRLIARHIGKLDYFRPTKGFDDMIAALAAEHEAVARWAVAVGPRGLKEMPDPRYAQDTGGSTAITRLERSFRQTSKEWEEDPTPGLALEEAKRMTLGASSGPTQIGSHGWAATIEGMKPAAGELEAGDPADDDESS